MCSSLDVCGCNKLASAATSKLTSLLAQWNIPHHIHRLAALIYSLGKVFVFEMANQFCFPERFNISVFTAKSLCVQPMKLLGTDMFASFPGSLLKESEEPENGAIHMYSEILMTNRPSHFVPELSS